MKAGSTADPLETAIRSPIFSISDITIVMPNIVELRFVSADEALEGICEGLLLTNYKWEQLTTIKEETVLLEKVQIVGILPKKMAQIKKWQAIAEGVHFCRDLINGNADDVTPKELVAAARKIATSFHRHRPSYN